MNNNQLIKKTKLLITLLLCTFSLSYAQVSLDPNESFYADAKNWETKQLITWLPQIRPYSISTIKNILETVIENGDESDKELALYYEQKFFNKKMIISLKIADECKISEKNDFSRNLIYFNPLVTGDNQLFPIVGLGYRLGVLAQNKDASLKSVLPLYYYPTTDIHDDPMTLDKFIINIDMTSNLTIGTKNAYGMFGITKLAYGPFIGDSVMLNGSQFHTGNLSFVYEGNTWGYSQVFSVLSRPTMDERTWAFENEKFFAFHSFRWTPTKKLAFTYFESSVFSQRFDPLYFLPVPYMTLQCLYTASDNLINGLTFDFRPISNLGFSICGTIDDIALNEFAKFDFGARFRFGVQSGVNYVPSSKLINNVSLDYTIVAPYTYSHNEPGFQTNLSSRWNEIQTYYNKDNYTTRITNLGTRLPPNSDRIQLKSSFTPITNLKVDLSANFIRHANIAESFTEQEAQKYIDVNKNSHNYYLSSDGSTFTSPITSPSSTRNDFMKQEHKMYVIQVGFDSEYEFLDFSFCNISLNLGYMFEYIINKGVDSHLYGPGHESPEEAKNTWINNFYNVKNNYINFYVKFSF